MVIPPDRAAAPIPRILAQKNGNRLARPGRRSPREQHRALGKNRAAFRARRHLYFRARKITRLTNLLCIFCKLCYLSFVDCKRHLRFFQYHLSAHEFFRLLSYTASYF